MFASLPRVFRRLAHPRSRRTQLWACVYRGTIHGRAGDAPDGPAADPERSASPRGAD